MAIQRESLLATFIEQRDALMRFLVRKLGNVALAEDITQETWIRAATVNGAQVIGNPRSYLFRIASNLALDHHRHVAHGVEIAASNDVTEFVADSAPSPEKVFLQRRQLERFLRGLDKLSPRTREVFVLVKVYGYSYAEAADDLGIAKNTIMVHMTNALAALDPLFETKDSFFD